MASGPEAKKGVGQRTFTAPHTVTILCQCEPALLNLKSAALIYTCCRHTANQDWISDPGGSRHSSHSRPATSPVERVGRAAHWQPRLPLRASGCRIIIASLACACQSRCETTRSSVGPSDSDPGSRLDESRASSGNHIIIIISGLGCQSDSDGTRNHQRFIMIAGGFAADSPVRPVVD